MTIGTTESFHRLLPRPALAQSVARHEEIAALPSSRLQMLGIHKSFGSTYALRGVSLDVWPGEVQAIVGENGAGKTTLMKVLSGAEEPDAGQMMLDGEPYQPADPHEARLRGVAMVYQELTLAMHLNVETNVMLGLEEQRWGLVRSAVHRQKVRAALALLQHPEIQPDAPVQRLSPGARQLVEVARALAVDARVIVFDEPTSSLTHDDTEHLFRLIRRLKERGVSILYISHFLEEVQRIADRYTVLRDGETVGAGAVAGTLVDSIIRQIVGRELRDLYPRIPHEIGAPILHIRELAGEWLPRGVELTLHRGEILGIFGLVGAGRTETLRTLFGLDRMTGGAVRLRGVQASKDAPWQRIRDGVGLLSEDRKQEGLALSQSVADNMTYSRMAPYVRWGWLRLGQRRAAVEQWLGRLHVRCRGPEQKVVELSGGNQQKLALARLLHQEAEILLLDEPTRGVDVGSKAEIYRLIGELAVEGKAILMVSSYLQELMGICDTLAVMTRGKLSAIRPRTDWTEDEILSAATGGGST
jgi:ribose transport system ATP-binding protein